MGTRANTPKDSTTSGPSEIVIEQSKASHARVRAMEREADNVPGVNGETGVSRVAGVNSGDALAFEWRDWPDASQPGSIDPSHKGPCAVYMKKVENSAASNNAAGDGWFKIMEDGYDSTAGKWCTEKLIPNDGHLA